MSDLVITEDREAVRHVILNRPEKRNAFNQDLVLAVGAALRAAADDPSVRCVVLRGNGPVFSAGMDVAALAGATSQPERLRSFRRACLEAWNLCEEMTKPVVAQIHGVCLGGALELALACDLRVVSEDARMGLPGGPWRLVTQTIAWPVAGNEPCWGEFGPWDGPQIDVLGWPATEGWVDGWVLLGGRELGLVWNFFLWSQS